jgi:hypothetical protein
MRDHYRTEALPAPFSKALAGQCYQCKAGIAGVVSLLGVIVGFLVHNVCGCRRLDGSVNLLILLCAAGMASWFLTNPTWLAVQRCLWALCWQH